MGLLDQAAAPAPAAPAQAPITPGLAQTAAAAGAPPPAQAAPAPAGPPQAGPPQQTAAGPAPAGPQAAQGGGAAKGGVDIGEEPATPEEQKEYERAMTAMSKVLYDNEKTSNAIVDQVNPDDKIDSTAKVSMLFMKQLDEKIDLDESVVAQMTEETVMRVMELAEARHGVQFDEREAQIILSSTWEGISQMFGMDEAQHKELVNSVGADMLPQLKEQYEAALNG